MSVIITGPRKFKITFKDQSGVAFATTVSDPVVTVDQPALATVSLEDDGFIITPTAEAVGTINVTYVIPSGPSVSKFVEIQKPVAAAVDFDLV